MEGAVQAGERAAREVQMLRGHWKMSSGKLKVLWLEGKGEQSVNSFRCSES